MSKKMSEQDPFSLFERWFAEAKAAEINDPEAMALATVDAEAVPDVRMILLKQASARGFEFYTNSASTKGKQLATNSNAALCVYWKSLRRQIRARGRVTMLTAEQSDAYFASRPRDSQIGAWASRQSETMNSRAELEEQLAHYRQQFTDSIPRPAYWSGYCLAPSSIEFWCSGEHRLHERIIFHRNKQGWHRQSLFP